jgi:hypothetical protein
MLNKGKNKWVAKGLIVSRNRLRTLNRLKRSTKISGELLRYTNKYQLTYKNLITQEREKKRERERERECERERERERYLFGHQKIKLREYGR